MREARSGFSPRGSISQQKRTNAPEPEVLVVSDVKIAAILLDSRVAELGLGHPKLVIGQGRVREDLNCFSPIGGRRTSASRTRRGKEYQKRVHTLLAVLIDDGSEQVPRVVEDVERLVGGVGERALIGQGEGSLDLVPGREDEGVGEGGCCECDRCGASECAPDRRHVCDNSCKGGRGYGLNRTDFRTSTRWSQRRPHTILPTFYFLPRYYHGPQQAAVQDSLVSFRYALVCL